MSADTAERRLGFPDNGDDTCLHGAFNSARTICTCDSGWSTEVSQDPTLGLPYEWCGSRAHVASESSGHRNNRGGSSATRARSIVGIVVTMVVCVAVVIIVAYCCYRKHCRSRHREDPSAKGNGGGGGGGIGIGVNAAALHALCNINDTSRSNTFPTTTTTDTVSPQKPRRASTVFAPVGYPPSSTVSLPSLPLAAYYAAEPFPPQQQFQPSVFPHASGLGNQLPFDVAAASSLRAVAVQQQLMPPLTQAEMMELASYMAPGGEGGGLGGPMMMPPTHGFGEMSSMHDGGFPSFSDTPIYPDYGHEPYGQDNFPCA